MAKLRNAGLILIAVLFLALSWGCSMGDLGGNANTAFENGDDITEPDAEQMVEIMQAYLDMSFEDKNNTLYLYRLENPPSMEYLGAYGGNFLMMMGSVYTIHVNFLTVRKIIALGDVKIIYPSYFYGSFLLWKPADHNGEGRFYRLEEAYDQGLLTQDNARDIREKIEACFSFFFDGIDTETTIQMLDAYVDEYLYLKDSPEETRHRIISGVYITNYGIYNGNIAVLLDNPGVFPPEPVRDLIGDVSIMYMSYSSLLLWKPADRNGEGRLYRLEEAYDQGLLTQEDAREIREKIEAHRPLFGDIDNETGVQIMQAYMDGYLKDAPEEIRRWLYYDVKISNYGVYNGNIVVAFNHDYNNNIKHHSIAYPLRTVIDLIGDVSITYRSVSPILLWKPADHSGEGRLCGLEEAYDLGLLIPDDAWQIREKLRLWFPDLY